jgi:HEAT repeat protein
LTAEEGKPLEEPAPAPEPAEGSEAGEEQQSPYGNLFVPLVLVPAGIVVALVLVFVFFGAISRDERSPSENLDRMVSGGQAERKQAAMALVEQSQRVLDAQWRGEEGPWEVDEDFLRELEATWGYLAEDDWAGRYVVACLQTQLGQPVGLDRILEFLESSAAPAGADGSVLAAGEAPGPDTTTELASLRFAAVSVLGPLGGTLEPEADRRVRETLYGLLEDPDPGIRLVAAIDLQRYPGEDTAERLRALLTAPTLELRGQAAISLSHLGDPAAAGVLRELVDPGSYEAERAADPRLWRRARNVTASRARAVQALGRLGLAEDRALLEELAASEPELEVLEAARKALEAPR